MALFETLQCMMIHIYLMLESFESILIVSAWQMKVSVDSTNGNCKRNLFPSNYFQDAHEISRAIEANHNEILSTCLSSALRLTSR